LAKEIHLPIQSGDNRILKKMNRKYTVEQYKKLIEKIRKKIPGVNISTDVIVGFPSETKKQFQNTVKAFKEIKFDKAYINKYSARAGTLAAKFKDGVPLKEKKRRWKILNDMINKKAKITLVKSRL
jgi:tRNA-2-methylthio-N6-dimethylallyladenosine synthase